MSKKNIPGSRHLSAKAKKIWKDSVSEENLPHFRQVVFNMVHEYCFFICRESSCDGCKVAGLRSWLSSLKVLPQTLSKPVIRELNLSEVSKAESDSPVIEIDDAFESETD